MSKWIAEFDLEDGNTMPEHMDLEYQGTRLDFHCKPKKIGHWIDKDGKLAVCSCCNRNNTLFGDYCKWCGAKMQEVEDEKRIGDK